jgi:type IV fimbrial biogenesis protein FimT
MDEPHTTVHQSAYTGFTVLELLITVSLTAILLVLGVPALQDFVMRQRMSAALHALHTQLELARRDAIHFNAYVMICPGDDTLGCANSNDWSTGWIVFNDINDDRQYQPGSDSLQRAEPGLEQIRIYGNATRSAVRFQPNGSAPGSNSSITFCDVRGPAHARKLVISNTGRIRRDEAPDIDPRYCS